MKLTFPTAKRPAPATEPIRLRLSWPPSVNDYWFTNKRGQVFLCKRGREYREQAARECRLQGGGKFFTGRLAVRLTAVYPDNRRRDLDNLLKAVLDALGHAEIYRDDSQVKLLIVETSRTEPPGWIDLIVGPKPGADLQNSLFDTNW